MIEARKPRSRVYDGKPYALLLDPFMTGIHGYVAEYLEPNQKVLEVGSGTGDLAFRVASTATEVVGVELSPAMVEFAKRQLEEKALNNVSFLLGDAVETLREYPDGAFDVATMVMVIHEMPAEARSPVLRELTRVARKVLCLDFRERMPWNLAGARNRMFEIVAGPEHFLAFRDFRRRGGIRGISDDAGLACEHVRYLDARTLEVCLITRPEA